MSAEIYAPQSDHEKAYFDFLWDVANSRPPSAPGSVNLTGELSGLAAVTFFQRSGVDKGFLKQIWSLSTPSATMNAHQFYVALRFIAMIQNGEMPISKERLIATGKDKFELPKFNGVDIPPFARPAATLVPTHPAAAAPAAAVPPAGVPPAAFAQAFAITPQEHAKYHSLFASYDKDKDGFLSRDETAGIFRQSGMDAQSVEAILSFADDDRDGRFTSKEFCAGFHIIVCVTKRGAQLPPALPPSLKLFLLNAPALPGDLSPAHPQAAAVPPAAPVPVAPVPAPVPLSVPVQEAARPPVKMDISSAFGSMDEPAPASQAPLSLATGDEAEMRASIDGIKAVAKKTSAAHEQALETNAKAIGSLQAIRQRLATDRIALEATLANAVAANTESQTKLDALGQEIAGLQEQIRVLKGRLDETLRSTDQTNSRVSRAQEEKQALLREIDGLVRHLEQVQADSNGLTSQLAASEREAGRLEGENKNLAAQSGLLKASIGETVRDNEDLRRILASLQERHRMAAQGKQTVQTQLALSSDKVAAQKAAQQQQLAQLEAQREELHRQRQEKQSLLGELSSSAGSSVTFAVAEQPAVSRSLRGYDNDPASSTKSNASSSTFGEADPFGDLGSEAGSQQGGGFVKFEDAAETEKDPFAAASQDAFGSADLGKNGPAADPFGSFGDNKPAEPSKAADPFAASAAFESFAESASPSASPLASSKKVEPAADPFGGFGFEDSKPAASSAADPFSDPFASSAPAAVSSAPPAAVAVADDPFAGFDDNVPPPKNLSPLPAAAPAAQKDPFADFEEEPVVTASQPASAPLSAKQADPFGDFDDAPVSSQQSPVPPANSAASSDPFGDFDSQPAGVSSPFPDPVAASSDPFAAPPAASSAADPFAAPISQQDDPFGSFGDSAPAANQPVSADPFGSFGASQPAADAFGASSFGESDPFGQASNAKADEDPFASFD